MAEKRISPPGPKEAALRALREGLARLPYDDPSIARTGRPKVTKTAPAAPATPAREAKTMKRKSTAKARTMAKKASRPKKGAAKKAAAARAAKKIGARKADQVVTGEQVADMICRPDGASMDELVAALKVEAHPMRAKIHYLKTRKGYAIENKDGRYYGAEPKDVS